jgi:hypothetical protein
MKKILIILIAITAMAFLNTNCDNGGGTTATTWQKMYGGRGHSIEQTKDGGYITVGSNNGTGSKFIKINEAGDTVWQKIYEFSTYNYDVHQTIDSGYISIGEHVVVKLDGNGNIQWQKQLEGQNPIVLCSIRQTHEGGYIAAGYTYIKDPTGYVEAVYGSDDYYVIKLDANGDTVWQRSFGGSDSDGAYGVLQTSDGGYIIAGQSSSNDIPGIDDVDTVNTPVDGYLIKLDADGNIVWHKFIDELFIDSISPTSDGGFVAAAGGVTKLDSNGNVEWSWNHVQVDVFLPWEIRSVQQTSDGGYIAAGYDDVGIPYVNQNSELYIAKLDKKGNLSWDKTYGGSDGDSASSIQQTSDGGYIVCGGSHSTDINGLTYNANAWGFYILKLDAIGEL